MQVINLYSNILSIVEFFAIILQLILLYFSISTSIKCFLVPVLVVVNSTVQLCQLSSSNIYGIA